MMVASKGSGQALELACPNRGCASRKRPEDGRFGEYCLHYEELDSSGELKDFFEEKMPEGVAAEYYLLECLECHYRARRGDFEEMAKSLASEPQSHEQTVSEDD